ncbi:TPA: DUF551 domain-containing protein [Klebsiella pneumoniae]
MTSKFSIDNRELLQRISSGEAVVGIDFGNLIVRELAAFRLAAMDQKPALHRYRRKAVEPYGPYPWHYEVFVDYPRPVECIEDEYFYAAPPVVTGFAVDGESECLPLDYLQGHKDGLEWASQLAEANHPDTGDWLYDDPIELAKAIRKGPDVPPVQPAPVAQEKCPAEIRDLMASHSDDLFNDDDAQEIWNACRAAMMQELKKSAGTEAICRSDENVQVLHTKSPAQSDCCPAQNVVVPAQSPIDHGYLPECECSGCKATARICTEMAVNSLVIPNEMTSEQAYEIGYYYGDPVNVFARGANWMRQHIIDSTLAAAPQLPGSEPATVPGKWIPVSERMPEDRTQVILWDAEIGEVTSGHYSHKTQTFYHCGDAIENEITHWMPPPCAPQEVK